MPDRCPCCGAPIEGHVNPEAPFQMYQCGTRVWRKGSFRNVVQSPDCVRAVALSKVQGEIDHLQEEHRPPVPPKEEPR